MTDASFPKRTLWTRLAMLPLVLLLVAQQGWVAGVVCVLAAATLLLVIVVVPERLDARRHGLALRAIRLSHHGGETEHGRIARSSEDELVWTSLDGATAVRIDYPDQHVRFDRVEIAPPSFDVTLHSENGREAFRIGAGRRRLTKLFDGTASADRSGGDGASGDRAS